MIDLTRTALSGVVASVLLMGPNVAGATQAHDTQAPTPSKHRKSAQTRHNAHYAAHAPRVRRNQAVHPATAPEPFRVATFRNAAYIQESPSDSGSHQVGLASWYGGQRWQGNRTSSGDIYDQNALTAAHASLPLGTRVRVTLVDSGRDVIVTINDRPGTRKRIIDLSRAAARELGILDRGIAMVTLTPL